MDWKDYMAYGVIAALVAAAGLFAYAPARGAEPCGTALIMAVDVSGSVSDDEYKLQRDGIAAAFRDPAVHRAIWNQPFGRMAVTVVEWSSGPEIVVPWTIISDEVSSLLFAQQVDMTKRSSSGATAIGEAVLFSVALFESTPCLPARMVIDVSGDGLNNTGTSSVADARDVAVAAGIVINGLPITGAGADAGLVEHYEADVKGGIGSFVIEAASFEDFARALRFKLVLEIAGVHAP